MQLFNYNLHCLQLSLNELFKFKLSYIECSDLVKNVYAWAYRYFQRLMWEKKSLQMDYKISRDELECLKILCVGAENINNFKNVGWIVDENTKNENLCNFLDINIQNLGIVFKRKNLWWVQRNFIYYTKRNHKKIQFIKDKKMTDLKRRLLWILTKIGKITQ